MFLIDTSVWIEFLKGKKTHGVNLLNKILNDKHIFGITSVIYQEILQGAATIQDFTKLQKYFITQKFYIPRDNIVTFQNAAKMYFHCRKKGITLRSSIDCLIAQIALENNLILIHNDRDYDNIAKIFSSLKLQS